MDTTDAFLSQPYDCLLLVHPDIQVLEQKAVEILRLGIPHLNLSKELSTALLTVSAGERSRFAHKWLMDTLATFQTGPILCTHPDLFFEPSLELDSLALFRQAARLRRSIILWPGDYAAGILSYAVPEHHHFHTWKISDSLLRQPLVVICPIPASQGA